MVHIRRQGKAWKRVKVILLAFSYPLVMLVTIGIALIVGTMGFVEYLREDWK